MTFASPGTIAHVAEQRDPHEVKRAGESAATARIVKALDINPASRFGKGFQISHTLVAHMGDITQILKGWNADREIASEQLTPLVYKELHKIAASYMRRTRPDHTLQATALINEAYMRLVKQDSATLA